MPELTNEQLEEWQGETLTKSLLIYFSKKYRIAIRKIIDWQFEDS
jgi:hypothetical protein